MHVIAGKAVAFGEALRAEFKTYIDHVVENAAALGEGMAAGGLRLVSGGTDNHLCLVDLTPAGISGKDAETLLDAVGLTVNKNSIPGETAFPVRDERHPRGVRRGHHARLHGRGVP